MAPASDSCPKQRFLAAFQSERASVNRSCYCTSDLALPLVPHRHPGPTANGAQAPAAAQDTGTMSGRAGAPSRSQQAFRWLLQGDDDEERRGGSSQGKQAGGKGGGSGKGGGRRRSGSGSGGKVPFIPGFKLRCDAEAEAAASSSSAAAQGSDLESLQEAFAGVLDAELVADVLASTGGDAAAAMEALLSLTGGGDEAAANEAPMAAEEAEAGSAPAATMAEAAPLGAPAAPCYWDTLPQEMKQLVFEKLPLRWAAASTCHCSACC